MNLLNDSENGCLLQDLFFFWLVLITGCDHITLINQSHFYYHLFLLPEYNPSRFSKILACLPRLLFSHCPEFHFYLLSPTKLFNFLFIIASQPLRNIFLKSCCSHSYCLDCSLYLQITVFFSPLCFI